MSGTRILLIQLRCAHRRPARAPVAQPALHFRPRRRRSWPMVVVIVLVLVVVVTGASEAEGPHPARRLQKSSHRSRLLLFVSSSSPPPPLPSAVDRLWIAADVVTTHKVTPSQVAIMDKGHTLQPVMYTSLSSSPPRRRASHPRPPPSAPSMPCVCGGAFGVSHQ